MLLFHEKACKITAFFLIDQIFMKKNAKNIFLFAYVQILL